MPTLDPALRLRDDLETCQRLPAGLPIGTGRSGKPIFTRSQPLAAQAAGEMERVGAGGPADREAAIQRDDALAPRLVPVLLRPSVAPRPVAVLDLPAGFDATNGEPHLRGHGAREGDPGPVRASRAGSCLHGGPGWSGRKRVRGDGHIADCR